MPDTRASTLVILPTYDEAENVIPLSRQVLDALDPVEVLVVDDNSPDGTAGLVERAMEEESRLHLIRREAKLGLGTAYLAGFRFALDRGHERVITMDCDFSHHPRYLPSMLEESERHAMVIGSRYVPGGGVRNWPIHRRALSRFASFYTRTLLGLPVMDCTSGYRCYHREILESVDVFGIRVSGYSFLEEMVWRVVRGGFSVAEVPIVFEDRRSGVSKINQSEIFRAAWHVLRTAIRGA